MKKTLSMKKSRTLVALVVTLIIVNLLVFAGPVKALTIDLNVEDAVVKVGEKITFFLSIFINSNEHVSVQDLTLFMHGETSRYCIFDIDGNKLSSCKGVISITKISDSSTVEGYGYGYGYGNTNGEIQYKIILDTSNFNPGTYTTSLEVKASDRTYSNQGPSVEIKPRASGEGKIRFIGEELILSNRPKPVIEEVNEYVAPKKQVEVVENSFWGYDMSLFDIALILGLANLILLETIAVVKARKRY